MPDSGPTVIIPTHNRSALLGRCLHALARQTFPVKDLEVIVVLDGCTDDTALLLGGLHPPYVLRVLSQAPRQGPAAARNAGAAQARGQTLIFLDDDIEPSPTLVAAHLEAHESLARTTSSHRPGVDAPQAVVIGYLPPALAGQSGFFRIVLRRWWEDRFEAMRRPGHRFHAFDLLSGNVSLAAQLFRRVGGFDPDFTCHEDYEFGVRLIDAGAQFAYADRARGVHHEQTDLRKALRRKYDEGRSDAALGRKHPAIVPELPLARLRGMRSRRVRAILRLGFATSVGTGAVTALGLVALALFERLRMRSRWRRALDDLLGYWYWRGVADALGSVDDLDRLIEAARGQSKATPELDVDLGVGMAAAGQHLEAARPAGVRLHYLGAPVGRILARPGAEPLRARHLRPLLQRWMPAALLSAMAGAGAIPSSFNVGRLRELCRTHPRYRIHGIESH